MKADAQTQAAVMATLDQFKQAYERRDIERFLSVFAPDPDVVLLGTGADEKRVGLAEIRAQAERDWSQSDAASWEWGWSSISAAGPMAWAAVDAVGQITVAGQDIRLPLRLTLVLEQRDGRWLWVQAHASIPAQEQAEGESFPTS